MLFFLHEYMIGIKFSVNVVKIIFKETNFQF
jgi:hypothetical protein